jgi:hypothetical protein
MGANLPAGPGYEHLHGIPLKTLAILSERAIEKPLLPELEA